MGYIYQLYLQKQGTVLLLLKEILRYFLEPLIITKLEFIMVTTILVVY